MSEHQANPASGSGSGQVLEKERVEMASCKDCKVERGYRPILDYVELCPLHSAAPELLTALNRAAKFAHRNTKTHSYWLSFRECQQTTCKTASDAIRKAEGKANG